MRFIFAIIFFFFSVYSSAQKKNKTPTVHELAQEIVRGKNTDAKKVRAIYDWITQNIRYQVNASPNFTGTVFYPDTDDTGGLKSLDERVADAVIDRGEAICEGYARLFRSLCASIGMESEVIHGYARARRSGLPFASNHAWNAVRIDHKWQLLDVTWGSGFVSFNGSVFTQQQDDSWYLASPEVFALDHFPDDPKWTLLNELPVIPELRHSPYRQRSFIKYQVHSFFPVSGILEEDMNEVLRFEVKTRDLNKDLMIGPDPFLDTNDYRRNNFVLLRPCRQSGNSIYYEYPIIETHPRWIFLVYNDDIILRYYLKPKTPASAHH